MVNRTHISELMPAARRFRYFVYPDLPQRFIWRSRGFFGITNENKILFIPHCVT